MDDLEDRMEKASSAEALKLEKDMIQMEKDEHKKFKKAGGRTKVTRPPGVSMVVVGTPGLGGG